MLEAEKVCFDTYLGFMVWRVYVKVNFLYVDVVPFMDTGVLWGMRCYVKKLY